MTDHINFTVAETARLLCCSRPTIEGRIGKDLQRVVGTTPIQLERGAVLVAYRDALSKHEDALRKLRRAAEEFGLGPSSESGRVAGPAPGTPARPADARSVVATGAEAQPPTNSVADLLGRLADAYDALAQERSGRAAAEMKIDELKRQLRQANAAIDALQPQPDANADLP